MILGNPTIAEDAFIAESASIIDQVEIANRSSVWFGAVLRADNDLIRIGEGTNIQDNAVIHVDPGFPVQIGDYCTIGHGAIVHGAKLAQRVLIGMNAVILNGVVIGENSIVGANALVTAGTQIPSGSLVMGSPAKIIRSLSGEERRQIEKNAQSYIDKRQEYRDRIKT